MRTKTSPPPLKPGDRCRFGRERLTVDAIYWSPVYGWMVSAGREGAHVTAPVEDFTWDFQEAM